MVIITDHFKRFAQAYAPRNKSSATAADEKLFLFVLHVYHFYAVLFVLCCLPVVLALLCVVFEFVTFPYDGPGLIILISDLCFTLFFHTHIWIDSLYT